MLDAAWRPARDAGCAVCLKILRLAGRVPQTSGALALSLGVKTHFAYEDGADVLPHTNIRIVNNSFHCTVINKYSSKMGLRLGTMFFLTEKIKTLLFGFFHLSTCWR